MNEKDTVDIELRMIADNGSNVPVLHSDTINLNENNIEEEQEDESPVYITQCDKCSRKDVCNGDRALDYLNSRGVEMKNPQVVKIPNIIEYMNEMRAEDGWHSVKRNNDYPDCHDCLPISFKVDYDDGKTKTVVLQRIEEDEEFNVYASSFARSDSTALFTIENWCNCLFHVMTGSSYRIGAYTKEEIENAKEVHIKVDCVVSDEYSDENATDFRSWLHNAYMPHLLEIVN